MSGEPTAPLSIRHSRFAETLSQTALSSGQNAASAVPAIWRHDMEGRGGAEGLGSACPPSATPFRVGVRMVPVALPAGGYCVLGFAACEVS